MSNFFKEKIVIQHSPFVEADFLANVRAQIVDRLDSQGLPHDNTVIEFAPNPNNIGCVLGFSWNGEFFVSGPQNAGQALSFYVNSDDTQVFLGKREARLGTMAKNFINGIANAPATVTAVELVNWANAFRTVFPRLEATRA